MQRTLQGKKKSAGLSSSLSPSHCNPARLCFFSPQPPYNTKRSPRILRRESAASVLLQYQSIRDPAQFQDRFTRSACKEFLEAKTQTCVSCKCPKWRGRGGRSGCTAMLAMLHDWKVTEIYVPLSGLILSTLFLLLTKTTQTFHKISTHYYFQDTKNLYPKYFIWASISTSLVYLHKRLHLSS